MRPDFLCSTSLLYKWRVIQPLKHTFPHHVLGKQYYEALFFIIQTLDRILFFFALFKPFFTILQDKLHSFDIQDDQSTHFFCTTNYSIDHIIERFHEENSIMPGLFSKKNLVLCDMQGNNYGLLVKTIKKIPKITFSASRTGSHF